jgi:hypothetical protein
VSQAPTQMEDSSGRCGENHRDVVAANKNEVRDDDVSQKFYVESSL